MVHTTPATFKSRKRTVENILFPNASPCRTGRVHVQWLCSFSISPLVMELSIFVPYDDCVCSSRVLFLETSGQHMGWISFWGFCFIAAGITDVTVDSVAMFQNLSLVTRAIIFLIFFTMNIHENYYQYHS